MEYKNDYKEERFDSYLNKPLVSSSRTYFSKQLNTLNKETVIVDDEDYSAFLQDFINMNNKVYSVSDVDTSLQLQNALKSLSAIEQAVIFLLFEEELTQSEAAKILEIYSKTVSKIKIRAINKLKKYFKENEENEK